MPAATQLDRIKGDLEYYWSGPDKLAVLCTHCAGCLAELRNAPVNLAWLAQLAEAHRPKCPHAPARPAWIGGQQ